MPAAPSASVVRVDNVHPLDLSSLPEAVVRRAEMLLARANAVETAGERKAAAQVAGMVNDPAGKALTLAMVDQVFRSHKTAVQGSRWRGLLEKFGVPKYLPFVDQSLMRLGSFGSAMLPGVVMPLVAKRLRQDSSRVIVPAETKLLEQHLDQRKQEGFRSNLNHLGEAILGENEAKHRMQILLDYLANPHVEYVSVKITAVFSQVSVLAWDATIDAIADRLRTIFRVAAPLGKFVNLDMEEYRDLQLTLVAFKRVLDEPEFKSFRAGIVLQAYLPDSWAAQRELTAWARERFEAGGSEIKVRLVKGANLAMENVEAELHGWRPAPYSTKADTDANFRRMLEFGCRPENAKAVRLGVASHNIFDVALALELRERFGTVDRVELEMLEGMANHQARVVRDEAGSLLLYTPAVKDEDFFGAMSYLVRRLDENTAPENFLRASFDLKPGTPAWIEQQQRFEHGWQDRLTVSAESRRATPLHDNSSTTRFENEPDSDWTQDTVRNALYDAIAAYQRPMLPVPVDLNAVLETATASQTSWNALGWNERRNVLLSVAEVMHCGRYETIACLQDEGKKTVADADAEVSEAIDFARYYALTDDVPTTLKATPLGVVVVVPPWNFPYAIPAGGVLAALMAGNSVILKPAPETRTVALRIVEQMWEAGVPRDVLQFFPIDDGDVGKSLLTDPRVAAVVLTGAYDTARLFQSWRPTLRLYAETSGKNAMIITDQADRELAIKDLVRSAFGHSGQKCSAASLAILSSEIYDDPMFRRQLADAAASLPVGPSSDLRNVVTPLIQPAGPVLLRALTTLEPGEEWLLQPTQSATDPCLWTPGIKLGVKPGSWFHKTECFGPVLGLMRAASLDQAITWQNATDFGLTAGLHTLDTAEQKKWREAVQAGNLYINRSTTGAIVQRQPFGGWKKSSVGPGSKAGGPNYVSLFHRVEDCDPSVSLTQVRQNYLAAWTSEFSKEHDPSALRCEKNDFRYRPSRGVIVRLERGEEHLADRFRLAAEITGVPLTLSLASVETADSLQARLPELAQQAEFLRTVSIPTDTLMRDAIAAGLNGIEAPITADGRAELKFWLREQSVSRTRHRYGLIGE